MKSVYGLKQASREWYMLLHDALLAMGFQKTHADHSIFVKWIDKGTIPIFVIVYVDDILALSPSTKVIKAFQSQLSKHFILTDKGSVKEYLGIEIQRHAKSGHAKSGSISLSQKKFINTLLHQYGMQNCKPVSTPFNEKEPLLPSAEKEPASPTACKLYQEQVGKAI
jgi:hypothetical protein